ncbi:MAG: nickel/cobalt exporter [Natronomonas sp.]|jgi:nickel/cobalt exporter
MTATLVGALVTAGVLGVTHAIEPDHVAGISSLSSRYDDARLSALVGVCFSAGHVMLVVAWLTLASLVLGQPSFPESLTTLSTLTVTVLLAAFGLLLTVQGYRAAARTHTRDGHGDGGDGDYPHQHKREQTHHDDHDGHPRGAGAADPHLHFPLVDSHSHDHTTRAYLKTGLVGALFTLSPPLSMMAFAGTLLSTYGPGVVALAVLAYAASITLTMGAVGAGVGTALRLFGRNRRASAAVRVVTGVGVTGFAAVVFADTLALV